MRRAGRKEVFRCANMQIDTNRGGGELMVKLPTNLRCVYVRKARLIFRTTYGGFRKFLRKFLREIKHLSKNVSDIFSRRTSASPEQHVSTVTGIAVCNIKVWPGGKINFEDLVSSEQRRHFQFVVHVTFFSDSSPTNKIPFSATTATKKAEWTDTRF